jgi:hypothetical protein
MLSIDTYGYLWFSSIQMTDRHGNVRMNEGIYQLIPLGRIIVLEADSRLDG